MKPTVLDRVVSAVSPLRGIKRMQARAAMDAFSAWESSDSSRRKYGGWSPDANHINQALYDEGSGLRDNARDACRNNPYAARVPHVFASHAIGGGGIRPEPVDAGLKDLWNDWAQATDFYGKLRIAATTVPTDGGILVRHRKRREADGLPVSLDIQLLDYDWLDDTRHSVLGDRENISGIDYDGVGRPQRYWIHKRHPSLSWDRESKPVAANRIVNVYREDTPGQAIGASWFAPVLGRLRMLDNYQDAEIQTKTLESALGALVTGPDAMAGILGTGLHDGTSASDSPLSEDIEPMTIQYVPNGSKVELYNANPSTNYGPFCRTNLEAISAGLNLTYASLTGDLSQSNFSSNRMGHLQMVQANAVYQNHVLIAKLCAPVWRWFNEMALIEGRTNVWEPVVRWNAPPMENHDRVKELQADQLELRLGMTTHRELASRKGKDWDDLLSKRAQENRDLDASEVVSDGDPRRVTRAGVGQFSNPLADDEPSNNKGGGFAARARVMALLEEALDERS